MPILQFTPEFSGQAGVLPRRAALLSSDDYSTITSAGYLNGYNLQSGDFVFASYNNGTSNAMLRISKDASTGVITASAEIDEGNVTLPVTLNHIAVFDSSTGRIGDDAATAINGGNIQAGLSGTAGYFASFPSASSKGSLRLTAVANTNDTVTTVSNAAMGQASTVSIPDPGASTANFILSANAGTQQITSGSLQVTVGNLTAGSSGHAGTLSSFSATGSKGSLKLAAVANTNDDITTISNAAMGQATTVSIPDPGASTATFILSQTAAGQTVSSTTASATPGTIRALVGSMTGSNTTMTSGNLVGTRGVVTCVGASGGFLYGAQGKIISTGTLSGSSWTAGVFGQLDISAATINAGQTACIWGDYGTSSGTLSDTTGMRGIAMTNTTAAVLNAQDYRYGNATYLMELAGAGGTLNYYATSGTSAGSAGDTSKCNAPQVLVIEINGSPAYIPVFTQNS